MNTHRLVRIALAALFVCGFARLAAARQVAMTVDASKTGAPISPYMYGFFTELLGNNEGGYWAEMLSDRKFFYPVDDTPTPKSHARRVYVRWSPLGPQEFVTMDKGHAYVGDHSPWIKLEAATPHGIEQSSLGIRKGRKYTGHVILAAEPGAHVTVSLVWGPGLGDRQTIAIKSIRKEYAKYPFSFTAGADSDDARFEIAGTGNGSFHIGAVSLMPSDNMYGFRADLIAEMKKIGPTMFRWPGGNMVSGYDWRDGIGDADRRPPRFDYAWNMAEQNDVGIDDYMNLNKLLGMEPYICVNTGFGDAHSAAEEVEYVNGSVNTPMGKLRAANGHREPYHVKWWNVGNEMFGGWQLGYMSLDHYVIKHNMVVQAMRRVDPTIKVVAAGATPIEASQSRAALMATGKHVAGFGSSEDFTGGLLAHSSDYLDAIAEHLYPSTVDKAFDADKQDFVTVNETLTDQSRKLANGIRCSIEAWDQYQRRFPALHMDQIPISMDEWVSGRIGDDRDSMFSPLSTAQAFNEMLRHSNMFVISAYTGAPELLAISKTDATIRPIGLMFELYRQHFGTIPVSVTGNSPPHEVKGTIGVDKPKTPAGTDTYPLDAVAAVTADHKSLTVAIVNPTESEQQISVAWQGATVQGSSREGKLWRISSPELTAANIPDQPPVVGIVQSPLTGAPAQLTLPKFSISIYELPIQ
ncbi:MAG: alpha-N-arabinofuranosidase [Candidatus Acidiferrales bacterium]|jgi:alpha-N-arabinofuranosidase